MNARALNSGAGLLCRFWTWALEALVFRGRPNYKQREHTSTST